MKVYYWFIFVFFFYSAYALKYADVNIYLDDLSLKKEGNANFDIFNNVELIKSDNVYTFRLSNDFLDYYIIKIFLPKNARILHYESYPDLSIFAQDSQLVLMMYGKNSSISLNVSYSVEINRKNFNYLYLIVIVLILLGILFYMKIRRRSEFDLSLLPEKEKLIMQIVVKKGKITQSELQRIINIPKASLHRHLKNLKIKGYVEIVPYGMTNLIVFKKEK
ncbi:MAG: winged helix-turn-helix transcriptional regulator [Candidatus Woesearchaeota archaeon]